MTIAELIEALSKIEDKTIEVRRQDSLDGDTKVEEIQVLSQRKSIGFKNERTVTWLELR